MLYMSKHKPVATVRTGRHLFTHTHFGSEMNVKIIMTSKKSFGKKVENSIVPMYKTVILYRRYGTVIL